jgi:hypothetical protein
VFQVSENFFIGFLSKDDRKTSQDQVQITEKLVKAVLDEFTQAVSIFGTVQRKEKLLPSGQIANEKSA